MQMRVSRIVALSSTLAAGGCLVLFSGCASLMGRSQAVPPPTLTAKYTAKPVNVDGALDDEIWQTAPVYHQSFSRADIADGKIQTEPGQVQLAWDDQNFYVGVKFTDSDIVAEGLEDQLHHYKMGDVCELFLKPEGESWYWEMYVTPAGKKTAFWFPGRGRLGLDSCYVYTCGLRVAAKCDGTLNNWQDRDNCWTAEMAMPIKDLTARGEKFGPGVKWRILVARYNYSRYLSWPELSMAPQTSKTNYHLLEDYGYLELVK